MALFIPHAPSSMSPSLSALRWVCEALCWRLQMAGDAWADTVTIHCRLPQICKSAWLSWRENRNWFYPTVGSLQALARYKYDLRTKINPTKRTVWWAVQELSFPGSLHQNPADFHLVFFVPTNKTCRIHSLPNRHTFFLKEPYRRGTTAGYLSNQCMEEKEEPVLVHLRPTSVCQIATSTFPVTNTYQACLEYFPFLS